MNQLISFDSNRIEDNNVFNPSCNMFIEASAGTGKTYTIQQIVARLIKDGTKLSNILIVTYTEKAAGELKNRILQKIQEVLESGQLVKDISHHLNSEQMNYFANALREIDAAQIYTIHSFCQKTLRMYAYDALRPFDMQLVDDKSIQNMIYRKIRDEWPQDPDYQKILLDISNNKTSPTNSSSDSEQADSLEKSLNIIEETIINAIPMYYLDKNGNECRDIVQLAKPSLISDFNDLYMIPEFKEIYDNLNHEQYLSYKLCIPKSHSTKSIGEAIQLISSWKAPAPFLDRYPTKYDEKWQWPDNETSRFILDNYLKLIVFKKNYSSYFKPSTYRDVVSKFHLNCFLYHEIPKIYMEWRKEKTDQKCESYQDMIHAVYQAVVSDHTNLLNQLRHDYVYGIIDEFQDTNQLQWDIFKTIFIGDETHPLSDHSLFVVGDPKQSIYAFQGADIEVYRHATQDIICNGKSLKTNYRSTNEIIEACNRLFDTQKGSQFFDTQDFNFTKESYSCCPPLFKANTQFNGQDTKPVWVSHQDISHTDFAVFAAQKIVECCSISETDGQKTCLQIFDKNSPQKLRNVSFSDFAILARTRSEFSHIETALRNLGIPFVRYKDDNLFDSRECLQWISLFKAIDADDFSSYNRRILNEALLTDFFDTDNDVLVEILSPDNASNPVTKVNKIYTVSHPYYDNPLCEARQQLAKYHALARQYRWAELLECIYRCSGLEKRLAGNLSKLQSRAKFQQIGNYCIEYLYTHSCSIQTLVKHLDNLQKGDEHTSDQDGHLVARNTDFNAVQLMTIHASKGLEFPVVIVAGGFKGYNPQIKGPYRYHEEMVIHGKKVKFKIIGFENTCREKQKIEEINEWKRLFYVAYTRASALIILPRYEYTCDPFLKNSIESFVETSPEFCKTEDNLILRDTRQLRNDVIGILNQSMNKASDSSEKQLKIISELQNEISQKSLIQHSYSSLTAKMNHDDIDKISETHDTEVIIYPELHSAIDYSKYKIYDSKQISIPQRYVTGCMIKPDSDYPRGAQFGNAIHEIFEKLDFEKTRTHNGLESFVLDPEVNSLIHDAFSRNGLAIQNHSNWIRTTAQFVYHTLNAILPEITSGSLHGEFTLSALSSDAHFPEVEFMLAGEFNPSTPRPCSYFSKGFMDLMFVRKVDGIKRYSILDWKSDFMEDSDYANPDALRNKVDHEYAIQRVLYSYCLIEWLKQFYPRLNHDENEDDYCERLFKDHFGGIYYAFLRGCHEGTSNGIYAQTWDSYKTLSSNYHALKELMFK